MNKILYVIRHCKATGQEEEAVLTTEGVEQAKQLAEFLNEYPIKKIISSPYVRAVETIKPYAEKQGIPIIEDPRLVERILSDPPLSNWLENLEASFDDENLSFEGGESSKEAMVRLQSLIQELVMDNDEHIALVSHGNLTTLLLRMFDEKYGFEEWQAMSNPDVFMINMKENTHLVERIWEE
ncbi:histidine phosphatase family protein [Bacillus salitolerans]|uniref:Histidine phosphatase family protein n=1 Tax=Bacillus salitolerans TaxID=1437434 RepID=A0ABW4LMN8_9BACI